MMGLKMSSVPGSEETGSHTVGGNDRSRREGSLAQERQASFGVKKAIALLRVSPKEVSLHVHRDMATRKHPR